MGRLTDSDKMPFGKYKGVQMQDVPAQYLLWLRDKIIADNPELKGDVWYYIQENLDVLLSQTKKKK